MSATMGRAARLVAAAALCAALAACSSKAAGGEETQSGDVQTGPGVTAEKISLGIITPLTGPIGGLGAAGVAGAQIYWDAVNANGGVCGRQVEIVAKDNKYSTQGSVTQYAALRSEVAAIANLAPGSDVLALQSQLEQDGMLVMAGSYEPTILGAANAAVPGSPYDIEAINGLSYLMDQGALAAGDTIGVIAYPNGIGKAVTAGAKAAADHFGLKIETTEIAPTDADTTAQVNTLRRAGATVIVMGTSAAQTVSAASVAQSSGYEVTIQATNLLSEADLRGPAKDAIVKHVVLTSNSAPFSADTPAINELLAAWQQRKGDEAITSPVAAGYLMADILTQAMNRACADKDLTRAGILKGLAGTGAVDTKGLGVHLDYSTPGEPPSRESFILKPDAAAKGGAAIVKQPEASAAATLYTLAK